MLDGYTSEKEQLEAIRKWWNENGKFLVIAVLIGLAIGMCWRYWHKLALQRTENASMLYQEVLQADSTKNVKVAQADVDFLMKKFSSTPYASLGALIYAKEAVAQQQLPAALTKLQWVIDNSKLPRLKEMARISAARILLSQGKTADASAQIKKVDDKSFMPLVNWVQGDIDTQLGDVKKAQTEYQNAKSELSDFPPAEKVLNQLMAQPIKSENHAKK